MAEDQIPVDEDQAQQKAGSDVDSSDGEKDALGRDGVQLVNSAIRTGLSENRH